MRAARSGVNFQRRLARVPRAGEAVDSWTYTFSAVQPAPEPTSILLLGGALSVMLGRFRLQSGRVSDIQLRRRLTQNENHFLPPGRSALRCDCSRYDATNLTIVGAPPSDPDRSLRRCRFHLTSSPNVASLRGRLRCIDLRGRQEIHDGPRRSRCRFAPPFVLQFSNLAAGQMP